MNRHYTAKEYLSAVKLIRTYFPEAAITTDVIVGFPGESEADHEASERMVAEAGFSQLHVFPFSRRKGTKADQMPGQLTRAEKAKRTASMMALGEKMQREYLSSFIGKELSVLVEEEITIDGNICQVGFSRNYIKCAIHTNETLINKIVTFVPKEVRTLLGELILM